MKKKVETTKEEEIHIFKEHAGKSSWAIGKELGWDKIYKDRRACMGAVYAIYGKVKNNPDKYGLSTEVVEVVQKGITARKDNKGGVVLVKIEDNENEQELKDLTYNIRNKSMSIINFKLDKIMRSKKKMEETPFGTLNTIAGTAFDKSRILRGESTENLAVYSRVKKDISPEEALAQALTQRTINVEKNNG